MKDQKTLYTQYYNDVYKLEEQKQEQQKGVWQRSILRVACARSRLNLAHIDSLDVAVIEQLQTALG